MCTRRQPVNTIDNKRLRLSKVQFSKEFLFEKINSCYHGKNIISTRLSKVGYVI